MVRPAYGFNLSFSAGVLWFFIVHVGRSIPNAPGKEGSYRFSTVLGVTLFVIDKSVAFGFSFVVLFVPLWIIGLGALGQTALSFSRVRKEVEHLRSHRPECLVKVS